MRYLTRAVSYDKILNMKYAAKEVLQYIIGQLPVYKLREKCKDFKASRKRVYWRQRMLAATEILKKMSRKRP